MRTIVTVDTPAPDSALTTLTRVKSELGITGSSYDNLLEQKIDEASSVIEALLGFRVPKETVTQTFYAQPGDDARRYLVLDRTPVVEITSVTVDGVAFDDSLWHVDPATGLLYALDAAGYPGVWSFCNSIVIAYSGGYVMPAESNSNLPAAIQGAAVDLVSNFWSTRGRDPALKSEEVPGVYRADYWVGAVGEEGQLPPSVVSKIAPFRRVLV